MIAVQQQKILIENSFVCAKLKPKNLNNCCPGSPYVVGSKLSDNC